MPTSQSSAKLGLTRRLLETLAEYRHPVSILTKGVTILRDLGHS